MKKKETMKIKKHLKNIGKTAYWTGRGATTFGAGVGSGMAVYGALNALAPGSGLVLGLGQVALSTGAGCAGFVFTDNAFSIPEKAVSKKMKSKKHRNHKHHKNHEDSAEVIVEEK